MLVRATCMVVNDEGVGDVMVVVLVMLVFVDGDDSIRIVDESDGSS